MSAPRSVLLLIADDWPPLARCYGNTVVQTPSIDRLAQRGTVFDHAFCTTPSCAASLINEPVLQDVAERMRRQLIALRTRTKDPWLEVSFQEGEIADPEADG